MLTSLICLTARPNRLTQTRSGWIDLYTAGWTDLLYGIFDGLLGTLPHAHDALDVVLLVLTAHSHPQQQLQQPTHLHRVTVLTCNPASSPSSVYRQPPQQQLQKPAHLHWVTALTCNSISSPSSPLTTTAATNQPPLGHCVRLQSSIISIITLLLPTSPATAAAMTHHLSLIHI